MTDDELVIELQRLDKIGPEAIPQMREVLRGQMSRLITLAARGVGKAKIAEAERVSKSFIPDDFPDEKARQNAIAYWNKNRRPDLVARIEKCADDFREHHGDARAKSWPRAWQTWYRNQVDFIRPVRGGDLFLAEVAFEQTNLQGWINRLRIFYEGDEDLPEGSWSPKWGAKPGEPGMKVPAEAVAGFQAKAGMRR